MSNEHSSASALQQPLENREDSFTYGTDVLALKLRIKIGKRFTATCFIDNIGMAQITNEGLTDDIKIIDGNNKRVLKGYTKIYFSEDDFTMFGFEKKEARMRKIEIPQTIEPELETTGVRIKSVSGEISSDITKTLNGTTDGKKTG